MFMRDAIIRWLASAKNPTVVQINVHQWLSRIDGCDLSGHASDYFRRFSRRIDLYKAWFQVLSDPVWQRRRLRRNGIVRTRNKMPPIPDCRLSANVTRPVLIAKENRWFVVRDADNPRHD